MRAFVVVISGFLLSAPGLAQASDNSTTTDGVQPSQPATPAEDSSSSEAGGDSERQICRRIETNTGSRVPWRRVCMTERQWRAFNRRN